MNDLVKTSLKPFREMKVLILFVVMMICFEGCKKEEEKLTIDPIAAEDIYETEDSVIISVDFLHVTEEVTQKDIDHTMEYVEKTKKGEMKKREPLSVIERGDGTYGIIDGNKTYSALKQLGATNMPVVVVDTPYQKEVEDYDDLILVNTEAESEFRQLVTALGSELAAEVKETSYLQDTDEIHMKAKETYGGDYSKIVDVLSADMIVPKGELQAAKGKLLEKYYVICISGDQTDGEFKACVMLSNNAVAEIRLIEKTK